MRKTYHAAMSEPKKYLFFELREPDYQDFCQYRVDSGHEEWLKPFSLVLFSNLEIHHFPLQDLPVMKIFDLVSAKTKYRRSLLDTHQKALERETGKKIRPYLKFDQFGSFKKFLAELKESNRKS